MPKDKFNIVEFALNGREAAKHFFFTIVWVLAGALALTGLAVITTAVVLLLASLQCSGVADGYVCTMSLVFPF